MDSNFSVGSLFAGIGGIDLGLMKAGFDIVWANDNDKHSGITYKFNFPSHKFYSDDIHLIKKPQKLGYVDLIVGGFPCQAFSIAGYRKGFQDPRGNLFFEIARFIDELKPKAFLLENVKNLVTHDHKRTFQIIKDTMVNELKYSFIPFILNSKDYGNTPQTRERIYIVGFKGEYLFNQTNELNLLNENINFERDSYICSNAFKIPSTLKLKKTIHDIIDGQRQDDKYYYKEDHMYFKKLKNEITDSDSIYQWRRVYVRKNKSNVCPTLTANMGTGGHNVPIIKDDFGIRKLTPKECLRFQGFPKSFKFPKELADSHKYKQIGNSVTVPVIKRIGIEILNSLNIKYGIKHE